MAAATLKKIASNIPMPEPINPIQANAINKRYSFADDGIFPNSALPLLAYAQAHHPSDTDLTRFFERRFTANGWPAAWHNGVYAFHHYHSSAHEVLGICSGRARLKMGGPSGMILEVSAGDVIVIPAGVAHKRIDASADFLVVGAYPRGQRWDMNDGSAGERPGTDQNIRRVPLPSADPLEGVSGTLIQAWF